MKINKSGLGGLSFRSMSIAQDKVLRDKAWLSVYNNYPLSSSSMMENDRYEILKRIAGVLFEKEISNVPEGEEFIVELNFSKK